MFSHVMVGSNDLDRAKGFYDALFEKDGKRDEKGRLAYGRRGSVLSGPLVDLGVADDLFDAVLLLLSALGVLPPGRALVLTLDAKVLAGAANWARLVALLAAETAGEAACGSMC